MDFQGSGEQGEVVMKFTRICPKIGFSGKKPIIFPSCETFLNLGDKLFVFKCFMGYKLDVHAI